MVNISLNWILSQEVTQVVALFVTYQPKDQTYCVTNVRKSCNVE